MLIFNYLWRWTLFYYLRLPVSSLGDCKIQVLLLDCRDEESIGEFKGFGKIIDIGSNIK